MLLRYISFFTIFLFLENTTLKAVIIYPDNEKVWLGNSKPGIIWDVDGVLATRTASDPLNIIKFSVHLSLLDPTERLALLQSIPTLIELKTEELRNPLKVIKACKRFGIQMKQNVETHDLDPVIDEFVAKHAILQQKTKSNIPFSEQIKQYASHGVPKKGTIKLLHKLHAEGYPTAIATNQGYNTFKRLMDAQAVPSSDYYRLIYTCDYNNPNPTITSRFIKKPDKEYFIDLKKQLAEKKLDTQPLIFIDDRKENVEAAAKEGIVGIHYENDAQLEEDLTILGILKKKSTCLNPATVQ